MHRAGLELNLLSRGCYGADVSKENIPTDPVVFTPDELRLLGDETFFRAKARIMKKMKAILEGVHGGLQRELKGVELLAPDGFNPAVCQFVKGEHLEIGRASCRERVYVLV